MKKLLEENKTLTQIANDAGRPPVPGQLRQSISRILLWKVLLKSVFQAKYSN